MTIRTSFVEHFGEDNALHVEEAALMHLAEGPFPHLSVHANDKWGDDPFRYLFLACIGHDCFTRWREWHRIDAEYEEILAWALEFGDLHLHTGDMPDYLALMAGAYNPWINWQKIGREEPEDTDMTRKRNLEWVHMNAAEFEVQQAMDMEGLRAASEEGMRLLNEHYGKDPYES